MGILAAKNPLRRSTTMSKSLSGANLVIKGGLSKTSGKNSELDIIPERVSSINNRQNNFVVAVKENSNNKQEFEHDANNNSNQPKASGAHEMFCIKMMNSSSFNGLSETMTKADSSSF